MTEKTLGIIGGSGLYDLPGLDNRQEVELDTPFGAPSDAFVTGTIHGVKMAFLPRHGRGHRLLPNELPFRANLWGMKQLGMDCVVGVSAVGSLRENIRPGELVLVDQFIDRTRGRTQESTFFGDGCVAHAHFADPIWEPLRQVALEAARAAGAVAHDGGTYVCMEGPLFSTRAESHLYRSWDATVIGMTNLQEAKLAREAEICYATIAMATDYDCWHDGHEDVTVEGILEIMGRNVDHARRVILATVPLLERERACGCQDSLKHAIMTAPERIPPAARDRLGLLIDKYIS